MPRNRSFRKKHTPPEVLAESAQQVSLALRMLLNREGLRQRDAAALVGMDEAQLSTLLSGGRTGVGMMTSTLARFAYHCGYRIVIDFEKLER